MIVPLSTLSAALLLTHAASASPISTAFDDGNSLQARTFSSVANKKACIDKIKQRKLQALCKLALAQFKNQGCDYSRGPLPYGLKSFLAPYTNQIIVEACAAALGTTIPSCVLPSPGTFQYCSGDDSTCRCSQSEDQRTVTCYYPPCRDDSVKFSRECFNERVDVFNVPSSSPGGKLYVQGSGGSSGDASGALLYGSYSKVRSGQVKLTVGAGAPAGDFSTAGGPDGGQGSAQLSGIDAAPNGNGGGGSTTIDCKAVSGNASCYLIAAGSGGAGQSRGGDDGTELIVEPGTDADSTEDDTLFTDSMQGESGQPGEGQGGGGGGYRGGRAGGSPSARGAGGGGRGRTSRSGLGGRSFAPAGIRKALCRDSSTTQFNTRCGDAYVSYTI